MKTKLIHYFIWCNLLMVYGIILSLVCFYTILLHSILLVLLPNCRRKSWSSLGWMFASPYMLGNILLFSIQSCCPDLHLLRSLFSMSANVLTLLVHVPWTISFLPWKHILDKCAEKWFHGHHYSPTVQLHVLEEMWELWDDPIEAPVGTNANKFIRGVALIFSCSSL